MREKIRKGIEEHARGRSRIAGDAHRQYNPQDAKMVIERWNIEAPDLFQRRNKTVPTFVSHFSKLPQISIKWNTIAQPNDGSTQVTLRISSLVSCSDASERYGALSQEYLANAADSILIQLQRQVRMGGLSGPSITGDQGRHHVEKDWASIAKTTWERHLKWGSSSKDVTSRTEAKMDEVTTTRDFSDPVQDKVRLQLTVIPFLPALPGSKQ